MAAKPINYDNIYRFVALLAEADEYFAYIKDDLIVLDLEMFKEDLVKRKVHPKQIEKLLPKREKVLRQGEYQTKKFFAQFLNKFNSPADEKMLDRFIDQLNEALIKIKTDGSERPGEKSHTDVSKTS